MSTKRMSSFSSSWPTHLPLQTPAPPSAFRPGRACDTQQAKEHAHWVEQARVTPRFVAVPLGCPGGRAHCDVDLVVDRACALDQVPVQRSRRQVERSRVNHGDAPCEEMRRAESRRRDGRRRRGTSKRTLSCGNHGKLRESHIVADADANLAEVCGRRLYQRSAKQRAEEATPSATRVVQCLSLLTDGEGTHPSRP